MNGTVNDFVAAAESLIGKTHYLFGGVTPAGLDCSGLVLWAAGTCGVTVPRTTQGEWAGLPEGDGQRGDLVLFDVPSDGPPQPQHVGICLGDGTMVNAPHTGLFVRIDPIWNVPGQITVYGYRRITFAPVPPAPLPTKPPKEGNMTTNSDGSIVYAAGTNGHMLQFSRSTSDPSGWSVIDITQAVANVHPGSVYTVQP